MTVNGKIIKKLLVTIQPENAKGALPVLLVQSILLSIVIGWTLLPSSNIFPPTVCYFWRIATLFLLALGCYGQCVQSKKMLFVGIVGCYMFLWLILALIDMEPDTYDFGPIPSLEELYHRIAFVTLIGILLLINFRTIRYRIIHPPTEIKITEKSDK